jgi:membrane-associated phospholipid phosphatase
MTFKSKFIQKYVEKLPLGLIGLLLLFGGVIFLFARITDEVIMEEEAQTDNYILRYLSAEVINPSLTSFMKVVTYMASAQFIQVGYGILILIYLLKKNYRRSIEIFVTATSGLVVNLIMKFSFHRLRPVNPLIEPLQSFSFPSGHATSGFIFYGLLVYLIWKTDLPRSIKILSGIMLISLSLLIGFSRIYLRVHYPSDVAAGFCVGFAWLLLLVWLMENIKRKAKKEVVQEAPTLTEKIEAVKEIQEPKG